MTLVVPFDGSDLSKAALIRAAQFDTVLDQGVIAVSVVPRKNAEYARERGWLDSDEPFDLERILRNLRHSVEEIAPTAEFQHIVADRWARSGLLAKKIRRFARDADASIVFIGSGNAGRIVRSMSVGSTVATDDSYDTMIISSPEPTKIRKFEEEITTEDLLD